MLCRNKYPKNYVGSCYKKIELLLSAYKKLIATTKDISAIKNFESNFFNHSVLILDNYFVHRSRTLELNQGNPCNEVRILCHSIMNCGNTFTLPYKNTVYTPDKSILKYKIGDEIRLNQKEFESLYKAYFTDIEKKFL